MSSVRRSEAPMTDARFGLFVGTFLPLDQLDWRSRYSTVVGLANQEIILRSNMPNRFVCDLIEGWRFMGMIAP
jgi:hypothetical protein